MTLTPIFRYFGVRSLEVFIEIQLRGSIVYEWFLKTQLGHRTKNSERATRTLYHDDAPHRDNFQVPIQPHAVKEKDVSPQKMEDRFLSHTFT